MLRGYTQVQMQTMTGIGRGTYSKIERGKRTMSVVQCIRIADALNTSTDYLLGLTDQIAPHLRAADPGAAEQRGR